MRRNIIWLFAGVIILTLIKCSSQKAATKTSTGNPNQIELPEPSQSHRKSSKVIGWPADKLPVAPEGFVVTKFADRSHKLDHPRWIYVTPNGDILVSQSKTNKKTSPNNIIIFRDTNKDGNWE